MKSATRFVCLSFLLSTLFAISSAQAATVTFYSDNFSDITNGNSTSTSGSGTAWDGAGRYTVSSAYMAGGAVKFGTSGAVGSATTTNLTLQAGTLTVQVDVKGWTTVEGTLLISVGSTTTTNTYTAVMTNTFESVSNNFTIASAGTYTVKVATSLKRAFIDKLFITETVSDSIVPLSAPTAYVPTATNSTSFTASWSSVATAESYLVSAYALTVVGSTTNAVALSGSPFSVATGTTTLSLTGLTQNSLYRYSVVAVGNGTTTGNSSASNTILVQTPVSEFVPIFTVTPASIPAVTELSSINFTISATVNGSSATVNYASGLPSGAIYTFTDGAFSWTPALGQAGAYSLAFTVLSSDSQTYTNTVGVTVNTLPLTAPAGLSATNITSSTFDASWNQVLAATQGYVVDVWYGSSASNSTANIETFFESIKNHPITPSRWTFSGIADVYTDKGLTEQVMGVNNSTIITEPYTRAVTNLSFRVQGRGTSGAANSILTVYGSVDGLQWTSLASYSTLTDADGDDENNIFTSGVELEKNITLTPASNFRKFKFVYTKTTGNIGIGNIAASYEGSGTHYLANWQGVATAGTSVSVTQARPNYIHFIRVGAKNGTDTQYTLLRVGMTEAPKMTVVVVR